MTALIYIWHTILASIIIVLLGEILEQLKKLNHPKN